jgi:hypothetical protein
MSFTSYSEDPVAALAGLVVERISMRGRYENSEDLEAGRLAEFHPTDGKLRLPQGTTLTRLIGGVPYNSSLPPGGYTAGDYQVPVLRRGQMWVTYGGTAPAAETAVNVMHSSTIATDRGKVTASATSVVAGSEISAVEGLRCVKVDTGLGIALVEFNLPA